MEYKKCENYNLCRENIEDCDVVCTNCFFIFGKGVLKELSTGKCCICRFENN